MEDTQPTTGMQEDPKDAKDPKDSKDIKMTQPWNHGGTEASKEKKIESSSTKASDNKRGDNIKEVKEAKEPKKVKDAKEVSEQKAPEQASGKVLDGKQKAKAAKESAVMKALPTFAPLGIRFWAKTKGALQRLNNIGMGKARTEFIQNLAMMLNAGMLLTDTLRMYVQEIRSRALKKIIQRMLSSVEEGHPLWQAMQEQHMFSPYQIALVRVGEEAGKLAQNLVYLAEQEEKDRALRGKVKMAMIYPTIVFVLMLIVVLGIGTFVLPNLVQVLTALNADLPLSTRLIIIFTDFMNAYARIVIPGTFGGIIVLVILGKFTSLRVVAQWLLFRLPGIGRLIKEASIARMGVVLGGLLQAGVPIVESIESLENVTTIVSYKKIYKTLARRVAVGDAFATCFHDMPWSRKYIPLSVQQLIITGERSGSMVKTYLNIAKIYERKAEETAQKLPVILEPVLLLIMGALVGFIAFSIIVPIYKAVGSVGV